MSGQFSKPVLSAKQAGQPANAAASNSALLIDKLNIRRSTPDSEALASSDDELDPKQQVLTSVAQKPARRSSWLNDITQPLVAPRKASFASSSMSPTASHPTTPSAEASSWALHASGGGGIAAGRGHVGSASFPWGAGIWNASEVRKEPPSRLTEVLPSPSSLQTSFNSFSPPSSAREQHQDGTIPFAIPLHPTPKTYRSQSYSVGQLDPDTTQSNGASHQVAGRGRGGPPSALHHRPSRPSMLSEMSNDGTGLDKVKEVDDDEEDAEYAMSSSREQLDQATTIEALARENAMLRKQNLANARMRSRSTTQQLGSSMYGMSSIYGDVDNAIDERDEYNESTEVNGRTLARRLSEYSAVHGAGQSAFSAIENRKLENVKKAYWQSSQGFGGLADIPQSRRHSFADVPTRQGSITAGGDSAQEAHHESEQPSTYLERTKFPGYEQASFYGGNPVSREADPYAIGAYPTSVYNAFASNAPYQNSQQTSTHRSMYGLSQPRQNQPLYIVLFKCSRADVFYVQEGTGLSVKPGDLVIVEADRGTDLGTVAQDNVEWAQAKDLKDHYAEEHYKWLMMYSQGAAGTADGTGAGLMAAANGLQGSAIGGMGPPSQHGMQEPPTGELKPKVIKRLAQPHEIQALRDKEGNEAKAKRVCMQKVKEHGLHMEILDAEFQMDWKKLTFYYFADNYINFNSLVTDLFKVYKTRIWMSAINPASFASPNIGLQAPSGIGPGAIGVTRVTNGQGDRRTQQEPSSNYGTTVFGGRPYTGPAGSSFATSLDASSINASPFQPSPYSFNAYSPFGNVAPRTSGGTIGSFQPNIDPYSAYGSTPDYHRFSSGQLDGNDYARMNGSPLPGSDAWLSQMQGLSLNGR